MYKGFTKISKQTERDSPYHLQFDFPLFFTINKSLETGNSTNGNRKFLPFCYEQKKTTTSGGTEWIFWEIVVPIDFQLKFPDFLAK